MQPQGKRGEGGEKMYMFGLGHMTKMATVPIYAENLKESFNVLTYVTGYQFNCPSGPGCIAHHCFGTVTLCQQKIDKIDKNECPKNSYYMTFPELR